jgi:hypothetical protein
MHGQDGISLHPYSMTCADRCGQAQFLDPGSPRAPYRTAIENVHRAMVQNGDHSGLWLTELGFSTCPAQPACIPEGQQASWMSKSIRVAACYPYVAGLTAFTLRDIPVPANYPAASYWDYHFGLMSSDFSPKPAFNAVSGTFRQLGTPQQNGRARSSRARAAVTRAKCRRILRSGRTGKRRSHHH